MISSTVPPKTSNEGLSKSPSLQHADLERRIFVIFQASCRGTSDNKTTFATTENRNGDRHRNYVIELYLTREAQKQN
jgi:hypothetical protein